VLTVLGTAKALEEIAAAEIAMLVVAIPVFAELRLSSKGDEIIVTLNSVCLGAALKLVLTSYVRVTNIQTL